MHTRSFLGSNGGSTWARGGEAGSGIIRRAHPASGAQWNVQVVKGKVNGKCLWNACKALSLGLLLMVLGATMATIGYYAEDLSMAQEVRGNYTVRVKNESRGFHLNNLSYAGPIVMGVGGFIVVAACVMTFEARDSAAKVVPARFKVSTSGPHGSNPTTTTTTILPGNTSTTNCVLCQYSGHVHHHHHHHQSLRNSSSQTGGAVGSGSSTGAATVGVASGAVSGGGNVAVNVVGDGGEVQRQRRAMTQAFVQFSKGLEIGGGASGEGEGGLGPCKRDLLKVSQASLSKSPSAPDLVLKRANSTSEKHLGHHTSGTKHKSKEKSRKTFAACALLNPQLLHRYALSVDETAASRLSRESLHGSEGSMAMDLHLDYPVTLRVCDRRKNKPLQRQRKIEGDAEAGGGVGPSTSAAAAAAAAIAASAAQTAGVMSEMDNASRRSSHSCSPRRAGLPTCVTTCPTAVLPSTTTTSVFCPHHPQSHQQYAHHHRSQSVSRRRNSNASDCTHRRSKTRGGGSISGSRRDREGSSGSVYGSYGRGSSGARLERAISSDSRLMGTAISAAVVAGGGGSRCCGGHHAGGYLKVEQMKGYSGNVHQIQCLQQCLHSSHRHPPIRNASAHCSTEREPHVVVHKGCSSDSDISRQPKHTCMHQYL